MTQSVTPSPNSEPSTPALVSGLYPVVFTHLADKRVVVVGGGPVGERKTRHLLAVGAAVQLISPTATPVVQHWAVDGRLVWTARSYGDGDLRGAALVFAATNVRAVNARVAQDAAALGIACNVADAPDEGTFHLPAVLRVDGLVIAVSTEAGDPTRAKALRDAIGAWLASDPSLE